MKKGNRKFLGSIASYVMALICITSWVALGVVLALTSANISIGGNISFTASDVYADVTGTVTGTATTNTLEDIHLTADTTSFTTPSTWSNINFDFVKGQDIVFTINVNNKSTENSILVTFTDNIDATNTTITRKSAGTTVSAFSALEVPKSATKSVEITLHVTNSNESVSGTFSLGLNLSSKQPAKDESNYPTLEFNYDDTEKTASVCSKSEFIGEGGLLEMLAKGNIVIPCSVLHNGEEYIVTAIDDQAFNLCTSLTSITIPASVTSIGDQAFSGRSALTSVTFENPNGWKTDSAGETSLNSSDLADPAKAATCLTSTYVYGTWTRS